MLYEENTNYLCEDSNLDVSNWNNSFSHSIITHNISYKYQENFELNWAYENRTVTGLYNNSVSQ